jgi:hypothetical protein
MSATLVNAIAPFLIATLVAWLQSILAYGVLRLIESKWRLFPYLVFFPLLAYVLYVMASSGDETAMMTFFAFGVAAALGGWFHRRSGGASRHWLGAFALVFEAIMLSVACLALVINIYLVTRTVVTSIPAFAYMAYAIGGVFYPALVPLALWIGKSLQLRPGLDLPSQS